MTHSLHLDIHIDRVDLKLFRFRRPVWEASQAIDEAGLKGALDGVLEKMSLPAWLPSPQVTVAIGNHAHRIKVLRGLPQTSDKRLLSLAVNESAKQFFLWNIPFVTTTVRPMKEDSVLGGAISREVIDNCVDACAGIGLSVKGLYPSGAEDLIYRPAQDGTVRLKRSSRKKEATTAIFFASLLLAIASPVLKATLVQKKAESQLAELNWDASKSTNVNNELYSTLSILSDINAFEADRRSVLIFLDQLTKVLPAQSALTTLRIDSLGIEVGLLSHQISGVLGVLEDISGVSSPKIIGPVSKDLREGEELERANVRFSYSPGSSAGARTAYTPRSEAEE